jgi:hypothetical protein
MQISSANLIAAMVLTAFVIERAIAAGSFILAAIRLRGVNSAEAAAARKELNSTLLRTLVAGAIAAAVIYRFQWMRLLETFGVHDHTNASAVLTWLVLVCGTDRLSTFIGAGADKAASPKANATSALEVHGTLAVDDASVKAVNDRIPV